MGRHALAEKHAHHAIMTVQAALLQDIDGNPASGAINYANVIGILH